MVKRNKCEEAAGQAEDSVVVLRLPISVRTSTSAVILVMMFASVWAFVEGAWPVSAGAGSIAAVLSTVLPRKVCVGFRTVSVVNGFRSRRTWRDVDAGLFFLETIRFDHGLLPYSSAWNGPKDFVAVAFSCGGEKVSCKALAVPKNSQAGVERIRGNIDSLNLVLRGSSERHSYRE